MKSVELERLINGVEALPSLPSAVTRLLEVTQAEGVEVGDIVRIIESDQALTAQLLRIANSSLHAVRGNIASVPRAVSFLGLRALRCVALGLGVAQIFPARSNGRAGFNYIEFWKHSLGCAVCAELLATLSPDKFDPAEAFAAGILHDLGKAVLSECLGTEYDAVLAYARSNNMSLLRAEQEKLGVTHALAGKWLSERWGLPDPLSQVMWLHHQPPDSIEIDAFDASLIYLVQTADAITRRLMIGSGGNEPLNGRMDEIPAGMKFDPDIVQKAQELLCKRLEECAPIFNIEFDASAQYVESLQKANRVLSDLSLESEIRTRRLKTRDSRLQALHEMTARLKPGTAMSEMLRIFVNALRAGFGANHGLCYLSGGRRQSFRGLSWDSAGKMKEFEASIEGAVLNAVGLDEFGDAVRMALAGDLRRAIREDEGYGFGDILMQEGLALIPLRAEGRTMGKILIDMGQKCDEAFDATDILAFADVAGQAILSANMYAALRKRSEELATAIWKKDQAYKQLLHSERLAAVGKMAAGVAHEVNNPLAIISGRAQMMLQKEEADLKKQSLNLIVDQCTRASSILQDLMTFARPALPKKEVCGVNGIVYEVLGMFESKFERHGIRLTKEFGGSLPKVLVDRKQIQQVLVNMLINAEHAITPPGEVTLRTASEPGSNQVQLHVTDTGCGIAAEHLGNIFEPFYSTKEEGKGTGLGLSLAHGIVTCHNGAISVRSEVGVGSTFTISLPAADDVDSVGRNGAPDDYDDDEIEAPARRGKRILVVDDEELMRELIAEALSEAGYSVEEADNGLTAIESVHRNRPDLITLDIRMPRMDGMALLRALREREPNLPVIIVTGLASEEELKIARELGAVACIRKPFSVEDLMAKVEEMLSLA